MNYKSLKLYTVVFVMIAIFSCRGGNKKVDSSIPRNGYQATREVAYARDVALYLRHKTEMEAAGHVLQQVQSLRQVIRSEKESNTIHP